MKRDMTIGNVTIALLDFVLPLTLGNIFQQLYNLVDIYIVGRFVGSDALSAVGSVGNLIFVFNAIVMGLKAGIAVICSESNGRGDSKNFNAGRQAGFILIFIATVFITLGGLASVKELVALVRVPEIIFNDAYSYLRIIILGYPFVFFFNYGIAISQAKGNSFIPFIAMVTSTITNIVLDIVFVYRFQMGVNGAAYATIISQAISMLIASGYIILACPSTEKHIDFPVIVNKSKEILKVSIPSILQQGILSVGIVVISSLINMCGTTMIAAVAIGGKIDSVISMPIVTMAEALSVFTAQNVGANKPERIELALKSAIRFGLILALVLAAIIYFKGAKIISLFLSQPDQAIIEEGVRYMVSIMIMLVFMIPFRCMIGIFTGYKMMGPVLGAFSLNILSRVTFAFLSFSYIGKYAIYIANPLSVFVGAVTILFFYINIIKKKEKRIVHNQVYELSKE